MPGNLVFHAKYLEFPYKLFVDQDQYPAYVHERSESGCVSPGSR